MQGGVEIECIEGAPEELLLKLAANELDLVLAETPAYSALRGRLFNHLLGHRSGSFRRAPVSAILRRGFPKSLTGAPFLLPLRKSPLRQALDDWFDAESITPRVLGRVPGYRPDRCLRAVRGGHSLPPRSQSNARSERAYSRPKLGTFKQAHGELLRNLWGAQDQTPRGYTFSPGSTDQAVQRCACLDRASDLCARSSSLKPCPVNPKHKRRAGYHINHSRTARPGRKRPCRQLDPYSTMRPSRAAFSSFCIFMASITTIPWWAATASPGTTSTALRGPAWMP